MELLPYSAFAQQRIAFGDRGDVPGQPVHDRSKAIEGGIHDRVQGGWTWVRRRIA